MDISDFKAPCASLLQDMAREFDPDLAERIEGALGRLDKERLTILVIGEFSRGKSTFVNALIGKPVLPSKVNPTTATINVLKGGAPARADIEYLDAPAETLSLPEDKINRFLDDVVTVANERAQSIRVVNITVPGRLERIQANIVDTPGVNDLDVSREEVTFNYLREADAAVMILDASQPISESERTFLAEKVLASDVNRIVFVVNKADELLYDPDGLEAIPRVCNYVKSRVEQYVGIKNPQVHAVAAKVALRARYKDEPDPFPFPFSDFEDALVSFASAQALGKHERLSPHIERIEAIIDAQLQAIQGRVETLEANKAEAEEHVRSSERALDQLNTSLVQLDQRVEQAREQLSQVLERHVTAEVENLRIGLGAKLKACATDSDLANFRNGLSAALRDLVLETESVAFRERKKFQAKIQMEFSELLATNALTARRTANSLVSYNEVRPVYQPVEDVGGSNLVEQVAVGAGLGFVGALMFGPVGVAAAVVGSHLYEKSQRAERAAAIAQAERARMVDALEASCDELAARASHVGAEISSREASAMMTSIRQVAESHAQSVRAAKEALRASAALGLVERRDALQGELTRRAVVQGYAERAARLRKEFLG